MARPLDFFRNNGEPRRPHNHFEETEDTVCGDKFLLKDKDGHVRAAVTLQDGEPRLELFDELGTRRLSFGTTHAILCDGSGKPRIGLLFNEEDDCPRIDMFGPDGQDVCTIESWVATSEKAGAQSITSLTLRGLGQSKVEITNYGQMDTQQILILDASGNQIAKLPTDDEFDDDSDHEEQ
jgi:hypothetical protein